MNTEDRDRGRERGRKRERERERVISPVGRRRERNGVRHHAVSKWIKTGKLNGSKTTHSVHK